MTRVFRSALWLVLATLTSFYQPQQACADLYSDILADAKEAVESKTSEMLEHRKQLEGIPTADWSVGDCQRVLGDAAMVVYFGLNFYLLKNRNLPEDLTSLAGTDYIPTWPSNPWSNDEPVKVLQLSDGFSAGNIVMQVCPPAFYSTVAKPRPLSFELAIYGPSIAFAEFGSAQPLKPNTWAEIPEGAFLMLGHFCETSATTRERIARNQASPTQGGKQ